jgi:hypothetical protein
MTRELDWPGCANARDLGGLRTLDGQCTRPGRLIRSGALDQLSPVGWLALRAYGVRTIIDLRNEDEIANAPLVGAPLTRLHVPLDGHDREFWDEWASGPQFGTPLYYAPHLEHMPQHSAAVITAIARAQPGSVLFHCQGGRDRSGMIAMLILALVDVAPDEIAADYELSVDTPAAGDAVAAGADAPVTPSDYLAAQGTTAGEVVLRTLEQLDVRALLLGAGVSEADLARIRRRLVGKR